MVSKSVFEFNDYKLYLLYELSENPRGESKRGERTRLASAMGCNVAYISQVLSGHAHLSLEQAERASVHFQHNFAEKDYFLILVQLGRAGTNALKRYFEQKLEKLKETQLDLKTRLNYQKTLTPKDQAVYYSAWYYTAIHFLASIEGYDHPKAIAEYLGLSLSRTQEVLAFLSTHGLVTQDTHGKYKTGPTQIHLGNDSPMLPRHHANWRMQAVSDLEQGDLPIDHVHYSSIATLALSDVPKVREILVQAIESIRKIIRPSADETMICYTLDLFKVGRPRR